MDFQILLKKKRSPFFLSFPKAAQGLLGVLRKKRHAANDNFPSAHKTSTKILFLMGIFLLVGGSMMLLKLFLSFFEPMHTVKTIKTS